MNARHLSLLSQIAYALPALALTAAGTSVYIFITRFYADSIGLSLSVIGAIVLGSRIWDAVIDPTIGLFADRTRSSFGRRRLWLSLSALPFALALLALFAPPQSLSPGMNSIWFAASTFLFFLFLSTIQIPYEALGAELSDDYDQRNRLFAIRQSLFIVGTVLAAALPAVIASSASLGQGAADQRTLFSSLGAGYAALTLLSIGALVWLVRERPLNVPSEKRSLLAEARSALSSRPFMILLAAYLLSGFGSALPATLIEFYVRYVLGEESSSLYLVLYFAVGLVTLPLWVWLARRYDKRNTWIASLLVNAGAFTGVFFLSPGSKDLYALLVSLSGLGFGGVVTIPLSMQADVIEHDALQNGGVRREGTFMGLWSIANKLSAALGSGIAFPILDLVGYIPNAAQNPATITALRTLYAGVPSLCYLLSLFIIAAYPLSRADFVKDGETTPA